MTFISLGGNSTGYAVRGSANQKFQQQRLRRRLACSRPRETQLRSERLQQNTREDAGKKTRSVPWERWHPCRQFRAAKKMDTLKAPLKKKAQPPKWHSRGSLPHFDSESDTQAVTFRL